MAPNTTRSPASAAASDRVQNAEATSGARGCMKLTEAPLATASASVSASAAVTSGVDRRGTISNVRSMMLSAPSDDYKVGAGLDGFIDEGGVGRRAEGQAVAGRELTP